jgi:hypothetical protein
MRTANIFTILLIFTITFTACQQPEIRYTQSSTEIDVLKQAIADYEAANWANYASHYADTAKIYVNSDEVFLSPTENGSRLAEQIINYESYGFVKDKGDSEMVVTDKGQTWVNYWGLWRATLSGSDKPIDMPVHLTAQFIDGKIVKQYDYFNVEIVTNRLSEEAEAKMEATEEEGESEGE